MLAVYCGGLWLSFFALDVYCSVPLMSQLSLLYIAVQYGCHNCIGLILKYAVVFIAMVDMTILTG